MTTKLAVLFGGVTVEHEVSVITAVQLMKQADAQKYSVIPVYIDKAGRWWTGEQLLSIEYYKTQNLFAPTHLQSFTLSPMRDANEIDVAILCFHGGYGEAGNVQGLLELAGIPYQGPGVVGSAVCFDKIMLRHILAAAKISQPRFTWFTLETWATDQTAIQQQIIQQLGLPVFIKPANGGSTIGIEKVKSEAELADAIQRVAYYDQRILVEAAIVDCIEVNVSVLGVGAEVTASVPEQPLNKDEFLSYADKYERGGGKKSGMASANRRIPAPISASATEKVQSLAKQVFQLLDCSGVVRIDFFINPSTEEIFVIEPNTIPGSMSFYLWEASGVKYPELIDRLVGIARERYQRSSRLTTSFESNILQMASAE